jgi:hypothetical protein
MTRVEESLAGFRRAREIAKPYSGTQSALSALKDLGLFKIDLPIKTVPKHTIRFPIWTEPYGVTAPERLPGLVLDFNKLFPYSDEFKDCHLKLPSVFPNEAIPDIQWSIETLDQIQKAVAGLEQLETAEQYYNGIHPNDDRLKEVCIEIIHEDFTAIHHHALQSCSLFANLLQEALRGLEDARDKARREEEQKETKFREQGNLSIQQRLGAMPQHLSAAQANAQKLVKALFDEGLLSSQDKISEVAALAETIYQSVKHLNTKEGMEAILEADFAASRSQYPAQCPYSDIPALQEKLGLLINSIVNQSPSELLPRIGDASQRV